MDLVSFPFGTLLCLCRCLFLIIFEIYATSFCNLGISILITLLIIGLVAHHFPIFKSREFVPISFSFYGFGIFLAFVAHYFSSLKAHCHGADWINKTITKKIIRQGSVISLYSEIHEDANDLIPFILETKYDPRAQRLGNNSKARALFLISTSQLASHSHDSVPLNFSKLCDVCMSSQMNLPYPPTNSGSVFDHVSVMCLVRWAVSLQR